MKQTHTCLNKNKACCESHFINNAQLESFCSFNYDQQE